MTKFEELVLHVCEHPEMYLSDRRFLSAAAWINGYSRAQYDSKGSACLDGFSDWLAKRYAGPSGIELNLVWQAHIFRLYPEDEVALENLPKLIAEFLLEKPAANVLV
jgi:hypothetical protein